MTSEARSASAPRPSDEWRTRVDLAAAFRLADLFGWSDMVWNHITAKVPGTNRFLINRFGLRYDEVTASNLVSLDPSGAVVDPGTAETEEAVNVTGFVIHGAIHRARPDVHCVLHTHAEAGLVISVLEEGLLPMIQDAMPLYGRVARHDYEGLSVGGGECERLAENLGDARAMILRNHGLLTCGASVAEAFVAMVYLERACRVQVQVLATGRPYALPSKSMCEQAAKEYERFPYGKYEWPALLRLADERSPGFRE